MRRILGLLAAVLGMASLSFAGVGSRLSPGSAAPSETRGVGIVQIRDTGGKEVGLYRESHALVIGAGNYTNGWPKLPGVEKDVAAVKAALEAQGFAVEVLPDPTRERLERAFTEFINRYGMRQENRLLFYFAGHGHTIKQSYGDEMGYIVPTDAPNPNTDRDGFLARAVDMQLIEVYAKRIQAKHALFLFDSCFSGQIFALSRAVPENITYKTAQPVRQFITSGSAEEQVPDRSIFREQLVSALQGDADLNGDRYVTGTELGEYLQERVTNYSRGAQHPQYGKIRNPNLDRGDFIFLAGGGSVVEESPAAPIAIKPTTGSLIVQTEPGGAAVLVNGARRGTAPLTLERLSPGNMTVRAELDGYDSQEEAVLVRAGKTTSLTLVLERKMTAGSVTVTSAPSGAKWYLDGAYAGTTPDTMTDVTLGSHRVVVKADGYEEWSDSVMVRMNEEVSIHSPLSRKQAGTSGRSPRLNSASLSEGLIAFFPFDGNTYDASGLGLVERSVGVSFAPDRFGNPEGALRLVHGQSYIEIPNIDAVKLESEASFSLWVSLDKGLNPSFDDPHGAHIFSRGATYADKYADFALLVRPAGLVFEMANNQNQPKDSQFRSLESPQAWNHLVIVYTQGEVRLFVNGERTAVQSSYPRIRLSNRALYIGCRYLRNNGRPWDSFQGLVDDFRIYNRSLTDQEVQKLFHERGGFR